MYGSIPFLPESACESTRKYIWEQNLRASNCNGIPCLLILLEIVITWAWTPCYEEKKLPMIARQISLLWKLFLGLKTTVDNIEGINLAPSFSLCWAYIIVGLHLAMERLMDLSVFCQAINFDPGPVWKSCIKWKERATAYSSLQVEIKAIKQNLTVFLR